MRLSVDLSLLQWECRDIFEQVCSTGAPACPLFSFSSFSTAAKVCTSLPRLVELCLWLQHRIIRNLIFKNAYMDKYRGEIVSRISRLDVLSLLNCEGFNVSLIPDVGKGEVLIDSRGKGSLQQQNAT